MKFFCYKAVQKPLKGKSPTSKYVGTLYNIAKRKFSLSPFLPFKGLKKKKSNDSFLSQNLVGMKIVSTFALQYRNVLPAKVHLAVLNWECECESPTVPQL